MSMVCIEILHTQVIIQSPDSNYPKFLYGRFQKKQVYTPKWMVKIMEPPIKIHDLGGTPVFGNTYLVGSRKK